MEGFSAINGIAQDYFRSSCDILVGGYSSYIYEKWLQLICPRSKIPAICSIKFRPTCLRSFWNTAAFKDRKIMMKFLVGSCEQRPMLRDGTVLRSSAVTIGTRCSGKMVSVLSVFRAWNFAVWLLSRWSRHSIVKTSVFAIEILNA